MKNIILLVLILIAHVSFAQTEKPTNKAVTKNFVKNYNTNDYKAIFSMFASEMQKNLPLDKTIDFLKGLKSQAGAISKHEFIEYKNGSYASYKTTFERAVLVLNISADANSKINGLFVKPYTEAASSKAVTNNLSTTANTITKKQSEIILKKSKSFPNQTQISFAIIKNGHVTYYGLKRNKDILSTVNNHKSIFEIGSITKVFTSTLLSNFVNDKKIELNDPINKHLEIAFNKGTKISFKELANHTSGLPALPTNLDLAKVNPANPYQEYKEEDLVEYLTAALDVPKNSTGKYQYSNLGAGLIGFTLGKIDGLSYERLLQKNIFSKYKMLNSTTKRKNVKNEFIKGLNAAGKEVSNWEFAVLVGAGGILSNVEDLSKFAVGQFEESNKELALTRKKTFKANDNMDIGLGWHILKSKSKNKWFWHNGGTGGYSSSMAIDIKNKKWDYYTFQCIRL